MRKLWLGLLVWSFIGGPSWAMSAERIYIIEKLSRAELSRIEKAGLKILSMRHGSAKLQLSSESSRIELSRLFGSRMREIRRVPIIDESAAAAPADPEITELIQKVDSKTYRARVEDVVKFGARIAPAKKVRDWLIKELKAMNYAVSGDFNVVATRAGTDPQAGMVVVVAHLDSVQTEGADDNASGTAALLEIARVLAPYESASTRVLLFSNGEENGLVGAYRYVDELKKAGLTKKVSFVINMDMVAYNSDRKVDMETAPEFKALAEWMAVQTRTYTKLTPKLVLEPWGSDHIPFIEAEIPCVMTVENWDTHSPCWHRPCDKLDTLNFDYAAELTRLNIAAVVQKAGVRLTK